MLDSYVSTSLAPTGTQERKCAIKKTSLIKQARLQTGFGRPGVYLSTASGRFFEAFFY
jgi:hypothetical protein